MTRRRSDSATSPPSGARVKRVRDAVTITTPEDIDREHMERRGRRAATAAAKRLVGRIFKTDAERRKDAAWVAERFGGRCRTKGCAVQISIDAEWCPAHKITRRESMGPGGLVDGRCNAVRIRCSNSGSIGTRCRAQGFDRYGGRCPAHRGCVVLA